MAKSFEVEARAAALTEGAEERRELPVTRLLAGIRVPDSPLISQVVEYARTLYEPYLFNHSMRSWLFAVRIAQLKRIASDGEVVAVGTILHDIGLSAHVPGPHRFEINGAAAAQSFVRHGARRL